MVVQACNPSTWEVENIGSAVQGHYQLQSKLEASLNYKRLWRGSEKRGGEEGGQEEGGARDFIIIYIYSLLYYIYSLLY